MLKDNKGFTVIELITSFVFTSILALSLFSVILLYKSKQTDSSIEARLLAFKSQLIIDIQEDIQRKGLKSIDYCPAGVEDEGKTIHPRCVIISFNDDTSKVFEIGLDNNVDEIIDKEGNSNYFYYSTPYVIYGEIRREIPDAANVSIDDEYILYQTSSYDGLETGTKLYKINFNLQHNDLDADINIAIVANGTLPIPSSSGTYNSYNIGDEVDVQLTSSTVRHFRVIQASSRYKRTVLLLYDDVYDSSLILDSTEFNILGNYSNRYDTSIIKESVRSIKINWPNIDDVRLITTDEIARIASFCPQYRGVDSLDASLSSAPSWLTNKSYWTMTPKELTNSDNGKKVWYVNSVQNSLSSDYVNENYALRPVIEVKKEYLLN